MRGPDLHKARGVWETNSSVRIFDENWYRSQFRLGLFGIPPLHHYRLYGWRVRKSPHPLFNTGFYLESRPDVRLAGIDPLSHFVQHGWRESSNPHPLFDVEFYLSQKPQLEDQDPLTHYLSTGWKQGLRASEQFDGFWYLKSNPDVADAGWEPLSHYVTSGRKEGRRPNNDAMLIAFDDAGLLSKSMKTSFWQRLKVKISSSHPSEPNVKPRPLALTRERKLQHVIQDNIMLFHGFRDNVERKGTKAELERVENFFIERKRENLRRELTPSGQSILSLIEKDTPDGAIFSEKIASWGIAPKYTACVAQASAVPILNNYNKMRLDAINRLALRPELAGVKKVGPLISVLMPVYRTPIVFLERAILSVLGQSYGNWELFIVNDFSEDEDVSATLDYYSQLDSRVKYIDSPCNLGIAGATNLLLNSSNGEYVALLDHDDMLTRDALESVVEEILIDRAIDVIYSDECKIDIHDVVEDIFTKPDWSPTLLFNCMYTGHLSVYKASIAKMAGGFDSRYDCSQDYDLALRVAELSPRVRHIEKILYGWRMIPGSAAVGDKPTARNTNIAALQAAIDRRRLCGTAVALPTANRVKRDFPMKKNAVSIVVPSDNTGHIKETISSIVRNTVYSGYEIVIVTNSSIMEEMKGLAFPALVKFAAFDQPYNFSAKCNVGAAECSGEYIVFFNDDVRVISPDWIESLLEYLTMPGVGIVGPKLLYENGRIQHAGMITGVRRLVGTAFHTYPSKSTAHYNFAQSVREVSLICGACLAISKNVFEEVGGFDPLNAGIAHSDVDLCFKARHAGYTCVYTPYAEMTHVGHLSIGKMEARKFKQDKADIYLMRRWGNYCARDPYFPKSMRDILYIDSQEPFAYFPGKKNQNTSSKDVLIFSHDLTLSGAPRIVLDMVRVLIAHGEFVLVMSPEDGPMRQAIVDAGGHVIIDPLALSGNPNITDLGKNFDIVIANTAVCWPVVQQFSGFTKVILYIHETALVEQLNRNQPTFKSALVHADTVLTGSPLSTSHLRRVGFDGPVTEVAYGVDAPVGTYCQTDEKDVVTISVLATVEPRKGQDLVISAYRLLPAELQKKCVLKIGGRPNDSKFYSALVELAAGHTGISFEGGLDYDAYTQRLSCSDIVVCASRDDTLPLVSLDALAAGKIVICSKETGTARYIENKVSGLILKENSPECIRDAFLEALVEITSRGSMGKNATRVFEENFGAEAFKLRFLTAIHL